VGTLISVDPTGMEVNDGTVFRLRFEFIAHDGQPYTATYRTPNLKPAWEDLLRQTHSSPRRNPLSIFRILPNGKKAEEPTTSPKAEDMQEVVLYHRANPAFARAAIGLAPGVRVDLQGRIRGEQPGLGVVAGVLPAIVLLEILGFLLAALRG
jgi:hypothetical protein